MGVHGDPPVDFGSFEDANDFREKARQSGLQKSQSLERRAIRVAQNPIGAPIDAAPRGLVSAGALLVLSSRLELPRRYSEQVNSNRRQGNDHENGHHQGEA